ncbi:transposable element Tcb1 transposase [Trichonephila clavipes]|uniref:Transposable element Tcb1 transposase n=1 Tax=Trichonephila clavipes TaxID=2585209 RepID=A0A8X6S478_TRICX|nr:transposable element Tcb1 transposase [Trichonephila clavipes]
MEPLGVYHIFERSVEMRKLEYVSFFGDGDSKGYASVKDIYGGRGKLTDAFIDKLQNYNDIAIRDNVNNLQGMQRAVIAAFSIVALMQNSKCMANALLDRIVGANVNKPYQRALLTLKDDGNVSKRCITGHPSPSRDTTRNEDRYSAVTAKRNRRNTASDQSSHFFSGTTTTLSIKTVYTLLRNIGIYARRSFKYVPLTATHCRRKLTWNREHSL